MHSTCSERQLKSDGWEGERGGGCPGKAPAAFVSLDILLPATLALTRLVTRARQRGRPVT